MTVLSNDGASALKPWALVDTGQVALLDEDPDLGRAIPAERWDAAREQLTTAAYKLARGGFASPEEPPDSVCLGYLILEGLVMREVTVAGRPSAELLGPGDVVRPWSPDAVELLPRQVSWHVLEPALLAYIGGPLSTQLAAWPEVTDLLIDRSIARAQALALQRSIAAHVRVDVRLLAFLWHLAERWGIVCPSSVRIDVPLTHATLARMVGARRPTVTTALQRLIQLGYIRRDGSAYHVLGEAAQAVAELEVLSPSRRVVADPASPLAALTDGR